MSLIFPCRYVWAPYLYNYYMSNTKYKHRKGSKYVVNDRHGLGVILEPGLHADRIHNYTYKY